jgi:hypothetical protein
MTKEEQRYFLEMHEHHNKLNERWDKAKEELSGLIDPKYFDFAESQEYYDTIGIVEIERFKPERTNYPDHEHCKEDGMTYIKTTGEIECYYFESKYEGERVEYWVWQTTGYLEDDYSGFLLLPLLDGKRFWKVSYSC